MTKTKVPHRQALTVAEGALELIRPEVARISIAGSLRRERAHVGDIEIIVEPKRELDMFGVDVGPDIQALRDIAPTLSPKWNGGERYMRFPNVLDSRIQLDLFIVHPPAQWGSILLIRTGSAKFSAHVMGQLLQAGYKHRDGRVVDLTTGETVPTPSEEVVFRLAGMKFIPPQRRG